MVASVRHVLLVYRYAVTFPGSARDGSRLGSYRVASPSIPGGRGANAARVARRAWLSPGLRSARWRIALAAVRLAVRAPQPGSWVRPGCLVASPARVLSRAFGIRPGGAHVGAVRLARVLKITPVVPGPAVLRARLLKLGSWAWVLHPGAVAAQSHPLHPPFAGASGGAVGLSSALASGAGWVGWRLAARLRRPAGVGGMATRVHLGCGTPRGFLGGGGVLAWHVYASFRDPTVDLLWGFTLRFCQSDGLFLIWSV